MVARGEAIDPDRVRRQDVLDVVAVEAGASDWRDFRGTADRTLATSSGMASIGDVIFRRGLTIESLLDGSCLPPASVTVLAGASPHGKSGLALQIARNVAGSAGPVAFFTREGSAAETVDRLLSTEARVDLYAFRRRAREESVDLWSDVREDGMSRLRKAAERLRSLSLNVYSDVRSIEEAEEAALAMRARGGGLSLVVFDYVSLFDRGRTYLTLESTPTEVSRALADLASTLGVPVLAVTPLQDRPLDEDNPRPEVAHLGAWRALADVAAAVVLIHRENVYEKGGQAQNEPGPFQVRFAKHPQGPAQATGTIIPSIRYVLPDPFDPDRDYEVGVHTWRPTTR
jgi:replicative DNA helicase